MYRSSLPPAEIGMRDIKFSRPYQEGRPSEIAHGLIVQVSTVAVGRKEGFGQGVADPLALLFFQVFVSICT